MTKTYLRPGSIGCSGDRWVSVFSKPIMWLRFDSKELAAQLSCAMRQYVSVVQLERTDTEGIKRAIEVVCGEPIQWTDGPFTWDCDRKDEHGDEND